MKLKDCTPLSRKAVINHGPCLLWESVRLNAALYEVNGLGRAHESLEGRVHEEFLLGLLERLVRFRRSFDRSAKLLWKVLCMRRKALYCGVDGGPTR